MQTQSTTANGKTKLDIMIIIITAHMDFGKFRDALEYGHHQLGISEELDNPQMRSEAYLNLARAHEKLGRLGVEDKHPQNKCYGMEIKINAD